MKQLYLLPLLLLSTVALFAQEKFELGFAVKGGAFATSSDDKQHSIIESGWSLGFVSQYGIYAQKSIGKQFSLSAEVLYQYAQVSKWHKVRGTPEVFVELVSANATTTIGTASLIVPFKFHFRPSKWSQTSLHVGAAATFGLTSDVFFTLKGYPLDYKSTIYSLYSCDCIGPTSYVIEEIAVFRASPRKWNPQMLFLGGVQRRLSDHTSIGVELLISPRQSPQDCGFFFGWNCCSPILGYQAINSKEVYPIALRSLAISLRHNILR